jgi:uncharacterized protein YbcI
MAADDTGAPRHPSLRSGISKAIAQIKREFYGKGPSRTRTYVWDRIVLALLDDPLTPVEIALKEGGRSALVRRTRLTFEDIMTTTFTAAIERLTGARVIAYHSQIVFDPDMAIEIFVLDAPPAASSAAPAGADPQFVRLETPGEAGDADSIPNPTGDRPVIEPGRGGPLGAAVADSIVGIVHEHWGKGPTRAKAYLEGDVIFCVLEEPLTTVERTLVEGGEPDLVRELRLEFQEMVNHQFAERVEELTGRPVLACHSQVVFDPDVLFEIFILGEPG